MFLKQTSDSSYHGSLASDSSYHGSLASDSSYHGSLAYDSSYHGGLASDSSYHEMTKITISNQSRKSKRNTNQRMGVHGPPNISEVGSGAMEE
jgi:hypothetical protein